MFLRQVCGDACNHVDHKLRFLKGRFTPLIDVPCILRCEAPGTYQESCPLGVLELRTSKQLTSICALGSS
jgi:hypothetical protein